MYYKTISDKSIKEWYEEVRAQARKCRVKYDKIFDEENRKQCSLARMQMLRSMSETYFSVFQVLEHVIKYKEIYDPIRCLSCKFDQAGHVKIIKKNYQRWLPLIMKTTDGPELVKNFKSANAF